MAQVGSPCPAPRVHRSQWIDYWAVDWDNRGDAFHNEWQTYRTRKTLSSAWRTGNVGQRWEVLDSVFERIHIRQAEPEDRGYTPRSDRANRVRLLINTAFD